jgi:hypothetical protein
MACGLPPGTIAPQSRDAVGKISDGYAVGGGWPKIPRLRVFVSGAVQLFDQSQIPRQGIENVLPRSHVIRIPDLRGLPRPERPY